MGAQNQDHLRHVEDGTQEELASNDAMGGKQDQSELAFRPLVEFGGVRVIIAL